MDPRVRASRWFAYRSGGPSRRRRGERAANTRGAFGGQVRLACCVTCWPLIPTASRPPCDTPSTCLSVPQRCGPQHRRPSGSRGLVLQRQFRCVYLAVGAPLSQPCRSLHGPTSSRARTPAVLSTVLARASLMREWLELGESNTMPLRVGCYHAVARAVEAATAVEGAAAARSHPAGSGSCGAHDGTAAREGEAAGAACGAGDAATEGRTATAGADRNGKPAAQRVFEGLGQACGDVTMAVLMRALRQVRGRATARHRVSHAHHTHITRTSHAHDARGAGVGCCKGGRSPTPHNAPQLHTLCVYVLRSHSRRCVWRCLMCYKLRRGTRLAGVCVQWWATPAWPSFC